MLSRFTAISILMMAAWPARAAQPTIVSVEGQVSEGILIGAAGGHTVVRLSPLTLTLVVDIAVVQDPWLSVYAGIRGETLDREAVGVVGGLRLRPLKGRLRLGIGLIGLLFPYTLVGVSGSVGACFKLPKKLKTIALCGDVEGAAYVFGNDLPTGRVAGQLQLALGVAFDAL